jgi:hypothetical protein
MLQEYFKVFETKEASKSVTNKIQYVFEQSHHQKFTTKEQALEWLKYEGKANINYHILSVINVG